jgi:hypothetical protein
MENSHIGIEKYKIFSRGNAGSEISPHPNGLAFLTLIHNDLIGIFFGNFESFIIASAI